MKGIFEIAGGSVLGRVHRISGKNNHDEYTWVQNDEISLAVVSDGCGGGKHSEVGYVPVR